MGVCIPSLKISVDECDLLKCSEEVKEENKSESLIDTKWHEYVRNHNNKINLNLSLKGGTQKSAQKKIIFNQNTNDSLYLCGGEFLCCGCYIKRRLNENTCQKENKEENEEINKETKDVTSEENNEIEENKNSKSRDDSIVSIKGISDIGNTSYLSACLQCLLASKPLNDYFKDSKWEKDINSKSISEGKVAQIYSKFVNISSSKGFENKDLDIFKNQICNFSPQFEGYDQKDSHKLFSAIIEALSQDLNKVDSTEKLKRINTLDKNINEISDLWWEQSFRKESNIINELFQGQLVNIIHCAECENDLYDFDNFTSLSLKIPKVEPNSSEDYCPKIKLDDCFNETMKVVNFEKEQGFFCKFCNKTVEITRSLKICSLPKLLVIHLKRFEMGEDNVSKNLEEVEVPKRKLDMRDYVHPDFLKDNSSGCYNLYGIIHHSGSLKEGHYTAEVKSKGNNSNWFRCDDNYVNKSNPCVISRTPYVFFYSQSDIRFKK